MPAVDWSVNQRSLGRTMLIRFFISFNALLAFIFPLHFAHGSGATDEENALSEITARQAPVAVSGNGEWRIYIDSKNVLHRINVAEPKKTRRIQLLTFDASIPLSVYKVAASQSARKIVFSSNLGCIGLLDLGTEDSSQPKQAWLPNGRNGERSIYDTALEKQKTWPCTDYSGPLALSSDGRLLATDSHVFDVETSKAIASLPTQGSVTLSLSFTKDQSKLAIVSAVLGGAWEGPSAPSDMKISLWDIQTLALLNMKITTDTSLYMAEKYIARYLPEVGSFFYIDSSAYEISNRLAGGRQSPLHLMEIDFHDCTAKPHKRLSLKGFGWKSFVFDPLGRWIAGVTKAPSDSVTGKESTQSDFELVEIYSLETGKIIQSSKVKKSIAGLTAAANGSKIHAITVTLSGDSEWERQDREALIVDGLIEINVNTTGLAAPKLSVKNGPNKPCKLDNETIDARQVSESRTKLTAQWAVPIKTLDESRIETRSKLGIGDKAETTNCSLETIANYFLMPDSSLWLDRYSEIEQIDLNTGKRASGLATPRSDLVCSIPFPSAAGYINYQGDTLSFRPFIPDNDGATQRKIIDKKTGWNLSQIRIDERAIHTLWEPKTGTIAPKSAKGQPVALQERRYSTKAFSFIKEAYLSPTDYANSEFYFEPNMWESTACNSTFTSLPAEIGFTISHFNSIKGTTCPLNKEAQTVFWSGLNMVLKGPIDRYEQKRILSTSQKYALIFDNDGFVRIYDGLARKEVGFIDQNNRQLHSAKIIADKQMVLIEETVQQKSQFKYAELPAVRRLVAYRF